MGYFNLFNKERFPPFLVVLFFLYLWERYSYMCMRTILSLYMTEPDQMNLADSYAYGISALFNATGYMIPILGGFVADRFVGFRVVMIIGALVLTIGHIIMMLAVFTDIIFYLGVSCISLGTGLFKGNITSLLGSCYDKFPKLDRTSGFTLFFASISTGSLLASVSSGYIATYISYHLAFGLAGFYMIIGLIIYYLNKSIFDDKDLIRRPELLKVRYLGFIGWTWILFGLFLLLALPVSIMFYYADVLAKINIVLLIGTLVVIILIYIGFRLKNTRERKNYIILICYFFNLFVFTAIELQLNTLFILFIDRHVHQYIGALHVPPSVAISVNPFLILIVGFLLSTFYHHPQKLDIPRMALALLLNSCCFFILYLGTMNADPETTLTSYLYPLSAICFIALGEILLAPIVSSSTTKYSPDGIKGLMIGMYFSIQGVSGLTEYIFGDIFGVPTDNEGNFDKFVSLEIYKKGFIQVGFYNLIPVAITLLTYPLIKYLHKPTEEEKNREKQQDDSQAIRYVETAT